MSQMAAIINIFESADRFDCWNICRRDTYISCRNLRHRYSRFPYLNAWSSYISCSLTCEKHVWSGDSTAHAVANMLCNVIEHVWNNIGRCTYYLRRMFLDIIFALSCTLENNPQSIFKNISVCVKNMFVTVLTFLENHNSYAKSPNTFAKHFVFDISRPDLICSMKTDYIVQHSCIEVKGHSK